MGYAIAAYAIVIGTLVVYGWRLHAQRRGLLRRQPREDVRGDRGRGR